MIPSRLTLKNFLSYRDAVLDFRGLHTACICGANGAGKSSLLEGITWAIWGKSRGSSEDDVIHAGAPYVRVDFEFHYGGETYRIIRSRQRAGKAAGLDFQILSGGEFRALSGKRIRDTQEQIESVLKLDHKTFVNSAYLRQGQADEFMREAPSGRKKILADLLQLDRYESLSLKAKDLAKRYEGQAEQLESMLEPLERRLGEKEDLIALAGRVDAELGLLEAKKIEIASELEKLRAVDRQRRERWERKEWLETQYNTLLEERERLSRERKGLQENLDLLTAIIARREKIEVDREDYLKLEGTLKELERQFQEFQEARLDKQKLEAELRERLHEIDRKLQQERLQLENLQQQEAEYRKTIADAGEWKTALEQLRSTRQRLEEFDRLYERVTPLISRRATLKMALNEAKAGITARIEQLNRRKTELLSEIGNVPRLRDEALDIAARIAELEKKEVYKRRVEEKGSGQRELKNVLLERQKVYQERIGELETKLTALGTPESVCPLCEQELDHHHRHRVLDKTDREQQEIREQIWALQEQIAGCDRELTRLRGEFSRLRDEITARADLQQKYGKLEARLEKSEEDEIELGGIDRSLMELEKRLEENDYAPELQTELQLVERTIAGLDYDEQSHALLRGEEKRLRWSEIKQNDVKSAYRRLEQIEAKKPVSIENIARLECEKSDISLNSALKKEIEELERFIAASGYDRSRHLELQELAAKKRGILEEYLELQSALKNYPDLEKRLQEIERTIGVRETNLGSFREQLGVLELQIAEIADYSQKISELTAEMESDRRESEELLSRKGGIKEKIKQIDEMALRLEEGKRELARVKKQYRVYTELTKAFGKNGLQTLMIENILPQLEAQTNHILARLTGNQLHVKFITQRAGKGGKRQQKMIDTLDIIIADSRSTRPYETYSGGETFRINFSIRLALAKLLTRRAGTALQMLIIDEGFGTQDGEGCDRLIGAINTIAPDFACILTVTHMPRFKEAFQHRIEVMKDEGGSRLILSS